MQIWLVSAAGYAAFVALGVWGCRRLYGTPGRSDVQSGTRAPDHVPVPQIPSRGVRLWIDDGGGAYIDGEVIAREEVFGMVRPCAATIGFLYGGAPGWLVAACIVWGISIVADSAQFSASIAELADRPRVVDGWPGRRGGHSGRRRRRHRRLRDRRRRSRFGEGRFGGRGAGPAATGKEQPDQSNADQRNVRIGPGARHR